MKGEAERDESEGYPDSRLLGLYGLEQQGFGQCLFPAAAIRNHRPGGLKQNKHILSQFLRPQVQSQSVGSTSHPPEARGRVLACPPQPLEAAGAPGCGPQHSSLCLCNCAAPPLPLSPSYEDACDCTCGVHLFIQDHLPISGSFTLIISAETLFPYKVISQGPRITALVYLWGPLFSLLQPRR